MPLVTKSEMQVMSESCLGRMLIKPPGYQDELIMVLKGVTPTAMLIPYSAWIEVQHFISTVIERK